MTSSGFKKLLQRVRSQIFKMQVNLFNETYINLCSTPWWPDFESSRAPPRRQGNQGKIPTAQAFWWPMGEMKKYKK